MSAKRAALYIRVSTDEQARHGLSLGEQRADLIDYANKNGYEIIDLYIDEGETARKSLNRRKELQRLINDVRKNRIDVIVFKCLDRWFRNVADYHKVQEILDAHNVSWECSQEHYNTTTANGRFYMHIRLAVAEEESDRTSERIKYVFEGKKRRKELISGNLPIGYKAENKHAVLDDNAPAIQYLFQWVYNGGSIRSSIRAVYDKFGLILSYWQAKTILRKREYIGEKYGTTDYMPSLVTNEVFQRVQDILKRNSKDTPTKRIYLFSGLLHCPQCGRRMGGHRGNKNSRGEFIYYQYRCQMGISPAINDCKFKGVIFETKLEKYLLNNIQQMVKNHIVKIEHQISKQQANDTEIELQRLQDKLNRLEDIYIDGMIDKEKYYQSRLKITREISELSLKVNRMPTIPPTLIQISNDNDIQSTYDKLTTENKQRFWKSIIASISFHNYSKQEEISIYDCLVVEFL